MSHGALRLIIIRGRLEGFITVPSVSSTHELTVAYGRWIEQEFDVLSDFEDAAII
jgi:hypothetical protein